MSLLCLFTEILDLDLFDKASLADQWDLGIRLSPPSAGITVQIMHSFLYGCWWLEIECGSSLVYSKHFPYQIDHLNPINPFLLSSIQHLNCLGHTELLLLRYGTDVLRGTMKLGCFLPSVKWMVFSFSYFLKVLPPPMKLSLMAGEDNYVHTNMIFYCL